MQLFENGAHVKLVLKGKMSWGIVLESIPGEEAVGQLLNGDFFEFDFHLRGSPVADEQAFVDPFSIDSRLCNATIRIPKPR